MHKNKKKEETKLIMGLSLQLLPSKFLMVSKIPIDLCHAHEYLMLALCKYQKWKERVKISEYRKFGDLILKSMAIVKFLKTENLTKNVW